MSVKYLVPRTYGRYLEKATYFKFAGNEHFYFNMTLNRQPKIHREDIVIDLPPREGRLKLNDAVLMPLQYPGGKGANAKCGPTNHDQYLNGTFLATQDNVNGRSLWLVKSTYISFVSLWLSVQRILFGYRSLEDRMVGVSCCPVLVIASGEGCY